MRKGVFGIKELMFAVLVIVILILFALMLFGMIEPTASSANSFGQQAAAVLD